MGKLFAAELSVWPPKIENFDEVSGAALTLMLAQTPDRPDVAVFEQAFHLTRLDLSRAFDAQSDYLRNQRWLEAGLTAKDKPMVLFLSRFMVEQLLSLGEATHGRVSRPRLLTVLAHTERLYLEGRRVR